RHSIVLNSAAGLVLSGVPPTTIAGQSFIPLPAPDAANWRRNWANGSGSPLPLHWYCSKVKRKTSMNFRKLSGIFTRPSRHENDANEELRFHLEKQIDQNMAA